MLFYGGESQFYSKRTKCS